MIADLLGLVLVLFQIVLVARIVVDWVGVLSPATAGAGLYRARRITHGITEPVIAPASSSRTNTGWGRGISHGACPS